MLLKDVYSDINGVLYNKDQTKLIRYPEGKVNTPEIIKSIDSSSFYNCPNLKLI